MKYLIFLFIVIFGIKGISETSFSLFEYPKKWKNQNNEIKHFSDFSGDFYLLSMVYTSCPHSCPLTIAKVQEIKSFLSKSGFSNIKIVLASFDDEVDTPNHLKQFIKKRKLDEKQWMFLSPSSQKDARELAVVLGISYKKLGAGDFSHSNVISLVGPNGRILAQTKSLTEDIGVFKVAMEKTKK
ncbi:MAG: SCO family protein [Bdellovibrionales bacterium]|nr:SCO family protein [Bdellovibrionales bacterium]